MSIQFVQTLGTSGIYTAYLDNCIIPVCFLHLALTLILNMSINEGLDRCVDDFNNINEDVVVDQMESHQLMENRPKDQMESHQLMEKRPKDEAEGDSKRARRYKDKGL